MSAKLLKLAALIHAHLPYIIAAILVCVNALIASGYIVLPDHFIALANAILSAAGLGLIYKRQS